VPCDVLCALLLEPYPLAAHGAPDRSVEMRCPVFVGSAFVAQYPTGGGNFWVPLQYLLGLRDLGIEAYWLELLWARGDTARGRERIATFRRHVEALGVADWVALVFFPDRAGGDPPGPPEHLGMSADELRARARDGLLLNLANSVSAPLREGFARTRSSTSIRGRSRSGRASTTSASAVTTCI
jgi:hypothetical protein